MPSPNLRVLHISGRSDHGGGPEHILQVISAMLPNISHHIACPANGLYWHRFLELLGRDQLLEIPHRRLSASAFWRVRDFCRKHQIRIIHSHGTCAGFYGRMLGLMVGIPVVHSFHGVPVTPSLKHTFLRLSEHALAHLTTYGVAVSAGEADIVHQQWRRYRGRLAVVPNGICVNSPAVPWSDWPTDGPIRIVSFTRYNRQKSPESLIDIACQLRAIGARFHIDAYGQGIDHPALKREAEARGVSSCITFSPPTDAPERALTGAHVYLTTSRWEGMPLSVLEAWRAGLVVVASNVVGNRDLVTNQLTGLLFDFGDSQTAAEHIHELMKDPSRAQAIRMAGAERVKSGHCRSLMALRLEWIYQRMAEHSPTEDVGTGTRCWPSGLSARTAIVPIPPNAPARVRAVGRKEIEDNAMLSGRG